MAQYLYRSALELAALIREGKATSTAIVTEHLQQIKQHNSNLNALVAVFEKEALATAAERDAEAQAGKFRGPLHGVPVTIKESFWLKGTSSTNNFSMLKDFIAPEDSVVVERIKNSGAVILGKTNVPRNLLDYQVAGDLYPEGKNPYNTEYGPGGSTGGGAGALAAGFTSLELGSDFGGSVRVPSNFCGLYGLKPTDKTVPLHGNIPLPPKAKTFLVHMAQAGPLARNINDLEVLWKTVVGPHESDRNIPRINWQTPAKTKLSEYRIAFTDGWPGHEASKQVSEAIQQLVNSFTAEGGKAEKKIPDATIHDDSLRVFVSLFPYVIAQGMPWFIRALVKLDLRFGLLKGQKKYWGEMNRSFRMDANAYAEALLSRSLLVKRWEDFFKEYDFLICPVAHGPAYKRCKLGSKITYDGREMLYIDYVWPYNACFNASGHPSLHIPLGLGKEGLPLGVQIVGPYWSEPELIAFGRQLAELTPGFVPPSGY